MAELKVFLESAKKVKFANSGKNWISLLEIDDDLPNKLRNEAAKMPGMAVQF